MKHNLYFEDSYGRLKLLTTVENMKETNAAIKQFLDSYNYKSYYTRMWLSEGEAYWYIVFDVGSHTEFFKLEFNSEEEATKFLC